MNFSDWVPDVQVEVRTASTGVIFRAIRWTLQEFCQRTHFWQQDIEPITLLPFNELAAGTFIYPISVPDGTQLITIRDFVFDSQPLIERSASWLDEHYPTWRMATGDPRFFLMMSDRQARFVPASTEVKPIAITGRMVLEPSREGTTFPDAFQTYEEGLVNGVLSRLLAMRGKPWTDGQRAALCQTFFEMAVSDAKQKQMRDWTYGRITTEQVAWT